MGNVKKCILVFTVILALGVVCSLSAFAYDPGDTFDFQLTSYPVHTLDNNNNVQSMAYFIQNTDYEVLYCEVIIDKNSGSRPIDFTNSFISAGSFFVDTNSFKFIPFVWLNESFGGYGFQLPTKMYFYDVQGRLVQEFSFTTGGSATIGMYYNSNWFGNGSNFDRFSLMYHPFAYFPVITTPSTFLDANDYIIQELPSGSPEYLLGYRSVFQPTDIGQSSIDATILVNGVEVYSSGGSTPSASVITGSSSGTITDSNGNTYNTYNEYNFELPEYDGEIGVGEYPTMPQFDDSALSVMDGGLALEWIYAKLQYFYSNQQKIALLLTSCLSLGVVMLILNKRS